MPEKKVGRTGRFPERERAGSATFWLLPPVVVGIALRLWNLRAQVLAGDELHEVRTALEKSLPEILSSQSLYPYSSRPLAALFRLGLDAGVVWSEATLRIPSLAAGILLLILLPVALARRLGSVPAALYAWLLALSPLLVLYSRMVRSYSLLLLSTSAALLVLLLWWRRPGWGTGTLFVLLGAGAIALHPGAGPFVASAFGFAVLARLVSGGLGPRLIDLAVLGAGLALATLAHLAPTWRELGPAVEATRKPFEPFRLEAPIAAAHLLGGTGSTVVAIVFWILAGLGFERLRRRDPFLAAATGVVVAGHLAGLLRLSPTGLWLERPFMRFNLVVIPLVLVWVAMALRPPARLDRPLRVTWLVGAALALVCWFGSGPLTDRVFRTGSFAHLSDFLSFEPSARRDLGALEAAWRPLLAELEPGDWIEAPWPPFWIHVPSFAEAQRVHGRRVLVASRSGTFPPGAPIRLRNEVLFDLDAFLATGARYLVIHRDLREEQRAFGFELDAPRRDRWRHFRRESRRLRREVYREWGDAVAGNDLVAIWDLEAARRSSAGRGSEDG